MIPYSCVKSKVLQPDKQMYELVLNESGCFNILESNISLMVDIMIALNLMVVVIMVNSRFSAPKTRSFIFFHLFADIHCRFNAYRFYLSKKFYSIQSR